MKTILILIALAFSLQACARGSQRPDYNVRQERKDQDKAWEPCKDRQLSEPVGKLCNEVCIKVKVNGECKEWKLNVKNFATREDFLFFRSGGFLFINEKLL